MIGGVRGFGGIVVGGDGGIEWVWRSSKWLLK